MKRVTLTLVAAGLALATFAATGIDKGKKGKKKQCTETCIKKCNPQACKKAA